MALSPSTLGCTCIAAQAWFQGEGKTRWENRESRTMVAQKGRRKQQAASGSICSTIWDYWDWLAAEPLNSGRRMPRMAGRIIVAVLAIAVAVVLGMVIAGICLGHPYIYDPL